ncbi:MAG TPA: hypothetical protein VLU46_10905 [Thermoanaerobaculia bacterium]|nr:hypothetical protein [Thermoanaerobaculia bacterium]
MIADLLAVLAYGAADFCGGVAGGAGVALLYRALSIGVMNVVAPVTAVCAVVVPVGGGIAFGARPALLSRGSCFTNGFAPSSCSASFQQRLQSC